MRWSLYLDTVYKLITRDVVQPGRLAKAHRPANTQSFGSSPPEDHASFWVFRPEYLYCAAGYPELTGRKASFHCISAHLGHHFLF